MDTGKIIKIIRTMDGISQGDLASELNISGAYLSQIENGRKEPSLSLLKDISKRFQVPLPLLVIDSSNEREADIFNSLQNILRTYLAERSI